MGDKVQKFNEKVVDTEALTTIVEAYRILSTFKVGLDKVQINNAKDITHVI